MSPLSRKGRLFWRGQAIYAQHVLGLIRPGHAPDSHDADRTAPEALKGWDDADLTMMIEEGRRQSDRQQVDLRDVRARAQWLFTVGVAALAALGTGFASTQPTGLALWLWLSGMAVLTWGVGGAAGVLVCRADFLLIHTGVLSTVERPVQRSLAKAYARMTTVGENTVATRITVLRQAVVFCLVGGYLGLIAALLN